MEYILIAIIISLLAPSNAAPAVQQNYTICNWARLRAGIIRDAIYLDGGLLWWQTAFVDGSTPVVSSDGGISGDMYRLNLSQPFDTTTTNLSALLETMPKAGGQGNNIAPNYIDGTILANVDELYMYGGLPHLTNSTSGQAADAVLGYEAYQYGPQRESWSPGFYQGTLGTNVSRYITNGAGVSAPSENLGFYFSGMHAPGWGQIYYEDSSATVPANTMIQVDLSTMRDEQWTNLTLPDEITPRANAELVWVPVSERGVLVAIGGVTDPEEIFAAGLNATQLARSQAVSPSFMESIPIYDIASQKWFLQNISGTEKPPQLTQFCSVLAVEANSSTFDIYIYGGYDGLNSSDSPSDDVWVLSLPAFVWTKVYEGTTSHGRSGHHCISPYPDKMLVIGGVHQNQAECVEGGFIQVFNLNTLEFQDKYLPDEWEPYQQPSKVISTNKRLRKRQFAWSSPELESIFATKYTRDIPQFYPYASNSTTNSSDGSGSRSSTNTTAIAVGVSIGVVVLVLTIVLLLLLRRKGMLRSGSSMSSRTKRSRISHWLTGTKAAAAHSKSFNDSASELNGETIQQYSNASAIVSSESSTTPIITPERPHRIPQEMAAVDRPHPPFELATPYNNLSHPRHSNAVDYAYNAQTGHSSRSTSSEYLKAADQTHYQPPTPYDDLVREARASVDLADAERSSTSSGQSSVPAWPLPATRPTWLRSVSTSSNNAEATDYLLPPPQQAATIPAVPQQYRSLSNDAMPSRLQPVLTDNQQQHHSTSTSSSSTSDPSSQSHQVSSFSSTVSPIQESQQGDGWEDQPLGRFSGTNAISQTPSEARNPQQKSLMEAMVSPITPDETQAHHTWQRPPTLEKVQPRRSDEREGRENWWR